MYAGHVASCLLSNHGEYADGIQVIYIMCAFEVFHKNVLNR